MRGVHKLFLALTVFLSVAGYGYDIDTHFYVTYLMARYAGIKPEVALQVATGAQWIDEAWVTSPMDPLLFAGSTKRRIFHAPARLQLVKFSESMTHGAASFFPNGLISEAHPNDPIASNMIMEGFKEGNLRKISSGIHILEDSYGHAGYSNVILHGFEGHHPDRYFLEPEKFENMIRTVFKTMEALRKVLPPEALDKSYRDPKLKHSSPNTELSAQALADGFLSHPEIRTIYRNNYFADPRYVPGAVLAVFDSVQEQASKKFKGQKIIKKPEVIKQLIADAEQKNPNVEAREILRIVMNELLNPPPGSHLDVNEVVNMPLFNEIYMKGYPVEKIPIKDFLQEVAEHQGPEEAKRMADQMIKNAIKMMTMGVLPQRFSDEHKIEFEKEGMDLEGNRGAREIEMELRIGDWQKQIDKMFGDGIVEFQATPTLKERIKGLAKNGLKGWADPKASPDGKETKIRVNYTAKQRGAWRYDMTKYFLRGFFRMLDYAPPDTLFYQLPWRFEEMVANGEVKPVLTHKEHKALREQWEKQKAACAFDKLAAK